MTQSEYVQYRQYWSDAFNFWKAHCNGSDTPEFWKRVVTDADALSNKYKGNKFMNGLIVSCVNDIENRVKECKSEKTA